MGGAHACRSCRSPRGRGSAREATGVTFVELDESSEEDQVAEYLAKQPLTELRPLLREFMQTGVSDRNWGEGDAVEILAARTPAELRALRDTLGVNRSQTTALVRRTANE